MSDRLDQKFSLILQDAEWLKRNDPIFSSRLPHDHVICRERGTADMAALIRIIIGQQISNKVAAALWQKLIARWDPNDAHGILRATDDDLRACGLSRQKISYVRGVAQAVVDKTIVIDDWIDASDDAVLTAITSLKGFGVWSAQMFMMFHLCHRHIWPAGDLGIQIGLQQYLGLPDRPNEKQAKQMADVFQGRESASAFLLWDLKGIL